MKVTEEMMKDYQETGEYGDQVELMRLTGIHSPAHMSQIMAGKADTSVSVVAKIKKFLDDRKIEIKRIHETDSN